MKKINVALLSGGRSSERDVSLNGGNQVFEALDKARYNIHRYDPETDLTRLSQDAQKIDIALIILHGPFGEDGTIQGFLDLLDIPYQGSGVLGSALAMNKIISKEIFKHHGLPTPAAMAFCKKDRIDAAHCLETLGLPVVVKPGSGGSSIGMSLVKTHEDLQPALKKAFACDDVLLIESYLKGTELTVSVVGNDELTALPVVEIIPDKKYDFFEYDAKYTAGETREICPARISDQLAKKAQEFSMTAHRALFCRGYSRTDMICRENEIYVLETNTIPGMTRTSLLPLAAKTAGISFTELLDRLIELGLEGWRDKKLTDRIHPTGEKNR
jgi:D-alanine-D-alanine ligase